MSSTNLSIDIDINNKINDIKNDIILELKMYSKDKKNKHNIDIICEFYKNICIKEDMLKDFEDFLKHIQRDDINDKSLMDKFSKLFNGFRYSLTNITLSSKTSKYIKNYYKNYNSLNEQCNNDNNVLEAMYGTYDGINNYEFNLDNNYIDYIDKIENVKYLYNNMDPNYLIDSDSSEHGDCNSPISNESDDNYDDY